MNFPATHSPEFTKIPVNPRSPLTYTFILSFLIIFPNSTNSQSSFSSAIDESSSSDSVTKFQPSLAVVIGILSIIFSLSFLILMYAKCCRNSSSSIHQETFGNLNRTRSRFSGIDKRIIDSLPFFKFSTLKGSKNGLECSVCLSAFEEVEILRLLPKCKHAFHIDCIDKWLENHSSCPLCRFKVIEDDIALFAYSNSLRFLEPEFDPLSLELFIEREGSSRFGPKIELTKDEQEDQEILHKFNHRIMIVNDHDPTMILKNRWSSLTSSDLLVLKSEMITCMSSNRFDGYPSPEKGSSGDGDRPEAMDSGGRRSVSEITIHPRFLETPVGVEEEKLRSVWLPIARETVQRFAHKENRTAPNGQRLKVDHNLEELSNV